MNKLFTILTLSLLFLASSLMAQNRYVDEIFTDVTVEDGIYYGLNTTIITVPSTGAVTKQPLFFDLYTPAGDSETERPLIIYFHTGNFLPNPDNGSTSGTKKDACLVEICNRLARMGYVVAVPDYRQGWNPISTDREVRVNTLINAAYRGVQDANTAVRFFKKSAAEGDNVFGIDPTKITLWGQGTGGYITMAANTLDQYEDVLLNKFIGSNGLPMVIESVNGDPFATTVGINPLSGDTLCYVNYPNYDSDFALCVNMGGAMGDISWLDAGDAPMISYQVPEDPFAPYMSDILIVPTTGDLIVEVQGAYVVQEKCAELGINDVWANMPFDDDYTADANRLNSGFEGLYPMDRPTDRLNPFTMMPAYESAPWEWWDPAFWGTIPHPSCGSVMPPNCSFHVINSIGNQDMSSDKGNSYIDSLIGYFTPRACIALDLDCNLVDFLNTDVQDVISNDVSGLQLSPNPASDQVSIRTNDTHVMLEVGLYDINGKLVQFHQGIDSNKYKLERNDLPTGMYIAKIRFEGGVSTSKLMFN